MVNSRKLRIAFLSPKRYSFYPGDYLERGLGGTESMLVLLSRALVKVGHSVDVYNCCYMPGVYNGVHWKPIWSFKDSEQYDVCISVRLLDTFDTFEIKSPLRAVWIHDDSLRGAEGKDASGEVNLWIAVSETEKSFIERTEAIRPDNWFVTRNAYNEDLYGKATPKNPGQMIYCSAPDRGLKYLLSYWNEINDRLPGSSLHVTGSFALWGVADEENYRFFADLYGLESSLKSVYFYERLSKEQLAKLQASSMLMPYPTTFDEMYCISALECMSVGTPVVSTRRAAMTERVSDGRNGFLIDGHPKDPEYRESFISKVVSTMQGADTLAELATTARNDVLGTDFISLAREWGAEFNSRLNQQKRG